MTKAFTFGLEAEIKELEEQLAFKQNCARVAREQYRRMLTPQNPVPHNRIHFDELVLRGRQAFLTTTTIFETECAVLDAQIRSLKAQLKQLEQKAEGVTKQ